MTTRLDTLEAALRGALGDRVTRLTRACGEITIEIKGADVKAVTQALRDRPELAFSVLIDLCGMDYSDYGNGTWDGPRFAVVYHLLSISRNWRVRLRAFCAEDDFPTVDSVVDVWPSANWFEREAFDFFGIVFPGHPDLRRILTDYGFVGHPFRKDFPVSGNVEMRYDPDQARVIYQAVTIEPREVTPRVLREENYAEGPGFRNG
jgi:NADH-quinone oxidoreductase subunit C